MPEPMRPARTDLLAAATAAGLRASSPAPMPCARVDASKDCEMPIRAVPLQGDVSWVVVRTLSTAFLRSSRSRAARLLRRLPAGGRRDRRPDDDQRAVLLQRREPLDLLADL